MKNIALKIQTLIISEITGSITQEEQETLNLLRDKHAEIQELSRQLYQQLKDAAIPEPAKRFVKTGPATANTPTIHTPSEITAEKPVRKRAIPAIAAITAAAAASLLFIFKTGNTNTIHFKQDFHINNRKSVILKLDARQEDIQGQSLIVNKKGQITTNEGNVFNTEKPATKNISVSVPAGGLYQLRLSDGTLVVLNSQSTITFPPTFGDQRELSLEGEAYFEVAKDHAKPFIIHTANITTQALGTAFNVNNYDGTKVTVSLTEGKVRVTEDDNHVDIHQDSAITYSNGKFQVNPFDVDKVLGWAKGKMYMQSENTQEIEDAAARYLDINVKFDHALTGKQARFQIERNKSAREFLEQFADEYTIDSSNNTYYLK